MSGQALLPNELCRALWIVQFLLRILDCNMFALELYYPYPFPDQVAVEHTHWDIAFIISFLQSSPLCSAKILPPGLGFWTQKSTSLFNCFCLGQVPASLGSILNSIFQISVTDLPVGVITQYTLFTLHILGNKHLRS